MATQFHTSFRYEHVFTSHGFQGICWKQRKLIQLIHILQFLHFFLCCSVGRQYIGEGHHLRHGPCRSTYTWCPLRCWFTQLPDGMPGVQSFRHSYPSHSFQKQIKGAGFPGNITVPKVMVKPMTKRLKTCKNVITLRFPSVNTTSTSAGVSWRLRCIERLIWVVSSRDNYRYGDLSLLLVYPAAALKVGPH